MWFREEKKRMRESIRKGTFWSWLFGLDKNKKKKKQKKKKGLLALEVGDVVIYDEDEYIVKNKYVYNDGGFIWYEYTLDDNGRKLFLSVEEDDGLEIGVFEEAKLKVEEPIPEKVKYKGIKYELEEHGFAKVKVETENEDKEGIKVEYWDFESDDDEYDLLSIEKWNGSELEVTVGWSAKEYEFEIYPANERE
jgi:hypothetical protein